MISTYRKELIPNARSCIIVGWSNRVIPKPATAAGLFLVVAAIALVSPWYPVTTSQVVPQTATSTYTTQFEVPSTTYQTVTVYNLPGLVHLPTSSIDGVFYGGFVSQNFTLQGGSMYYLEATMECQDCYVIVLLAGFAPSGIYTGPWFFYKDAFAYLNSTGQTSFVAPITAHYSVMMYYVTPNTFEGPPYYVDAERGTVSALSITGTVPQSVELTQSQTLTTYRTTSVTEYSQATVPPYTTLGLTTSATVLVLLAVIVVLPILFERQKR